MTFTFCTLAIGEKYYKAAKELFDGIKSTCGDFCNFVIVGDTEGDVLVSPEKYEFVTAKIFNYNLKHLAIKHSLDKGGEYIIFVDADWHLHENFHRDKLLKFYQSIKSNGNDFFFERPHLIKAAKHDPFVFWHHKLPYYPEILTGKYDNGHVCNEQFMVFRNFNKLHDFVGAWEKRYFKNVEDAYNPFAEGLEIGMSVIDSRLRFNWQQNYFFILNECFWFLNPSGVKYIRFT